MYCFRYNPSCDVDTNIANFYLTRTDSHSSSVYYHSISNANTTSHPCHYA